MPPGKRVTAFSYVARKPLMRDAGRHGRQQAAKFQKFQNSGFAMPGVYCNLNFGGEKSRSLALRVCVAISSRYSRCRRRPMPRNIRHLASGALQFSTPAA